MRSVETVRISHIHNDSDEAITVSSTNEEALDREVGEKKQVGYKITGKRFAMGGPTETEYCETMKRLKS